jgi:hypothetical protein
MSWITRTHYRCARKKTMRIGTMAVTAAAIWYGQLE